MTESQEEKQINIFLGNFTKIKERKKEKIIFGLGFDGL